ncbi:hypothetical protein BC835DRAFT_1346499 [Cytidiella melzeri]|nr:hypothetical protein BC835DRAFT_1346499 [Cytidiella melzeri]
MLVLRATPPQSSLGIHRHTNMNCPFRQSLNYIKSTRHSAVLNKYHQGHTSHLHHIHYNSSIFKHRSTG